MLLCNIFSKSDSLEDLDPCVLILDEEEDDNDVELYWEGADEDEWIMWMEEADDDEWIMWMEKVDEDEYNAWTEQQRVESLPRLRQEKEEENLYWTVFTNCTAIVLPFIVFETVNFAFGP